MKNTLLIGILSLFMCVNAQVTKVSIQASGLTCSMCSNAISKALNTLDFIEKIDVDLQHYTFEIFFRKNREVDFYRIKKKIEDAGFSVSSFIATIDFDNVALSQDQPISVGNNKLIFLETKEKTLNGPRQVHLVDKGYISSKEYKKTALPLLPLNVYHVAI